MSNYLWKKKVQEPEIQLPERDARVLEKYTHKMKKFDEMIKVCCCWIGYDVLLGKLMCFISCLRHSPSSLSKEFIPIFGKVISLYFALSLYRLACQCDLPRSIKRRMLYHVSIDFLVSVSVVESVHAYWISPKAWLDTNFRHPLGYVVQSSQQECSHIAKILVRAGQTRCQ